MGEKVAILGGGVGALSAAFELTELDPSGRCEITVYQVGWRLGGKGAVGRNVDSRLRVEEHGLHVWTGFYDNAFYLVDRCYDALERSGMPVPFGSRLEAFSPLDFVTLMQAGNDWIPWRFDLPRRDGVPGEFDSAEFVTLMAYVHRIFEASGRRLGASDLSRDGQIIRPYRRANEYALQLPSDPAQVTAEERTELRTRIALARNAIVEARRQVDVVPGLAGDPAAIGKAMLARERDIVLLELALTLAYGILAEDVFARGFDALDHMEWSSWMGTMNGCSPESLDSAIVQACYDYVFGSVRNTCDFAAGTGTRLLLKMLFGYKGSFFYTMRASMGELLFAPLYRVLKARNVKFKFFHRVESLELSSDEKTIDRIVLTEQARLRRAEYDPLISIDDGAGGRLDSWPSHPKYDDLLDGDDIRRGGHDLESAWVDWPPAWGGGKPPPLLRGKDFDHVVLGIGLGAFPWICEELVAALAPWRDMVTRVTTTPTMALQLWTTCALDELKPPQDPNKPAEDPNIRSAFAKPLDTWGDMSQMLEQESLPRALGLHYFVGTFEPDRTMPPPGPAGNAYPALQLSYAKGRQLAWVETHLPKLWPGFLDDAGNIQWELLFDLGGGTGRARLDAQYARVNINPSDQYVRSVANSLTARLEAGASGIANLFLAGDWVRTGLNAGCVESAVMAGRAAAGAITGVDIDMPNANDFDSPGLVNVLLPITTFLRKLDQRAAAGTGVIDAYCTLVEMSIADIEARLPPGVKVSNPAGGTKHDVVLVFALQREVRPGVVPFGGLRYAEVFEIVPEVKFEHPTLRSPVLFSFMPNLLVDDPVPVFVGQSIYGFNKHLARIHHSDGSFDVRSTFETTRASFAPVGLPGGVDRFSDIRAIARKLQLPLIGQAADGSFMVSGVRFELDAASFQNAAGTIEAGRPFPAAMKSLQLQADPTKRPWGFRMESKWRLSFPFAEVPRAGAADPNLRALVAHLTESVVGRLPVRRTIR